MSERAYIQPLKALHCGSRSCTGVYGLHNDYMLVIGGVRIEEPIKLVCLSCGYAYTWRPLPAKVPHEYVPNR